MGESYGLGQAGAGAGGKVLTESQLRTAWLAVYDRMQKANREEFSQLDHKKYQDGLFSEAAGRLLVLLGLRAKPAEGSFRKLKNREYPAGAKGMLLRAMELHKHAVGFLVRFPYHLFDAFLFGYFRRNISFSFAHSTEDFFAVKDALERSKAREEGRPLREEGPSALRWLESSMSRQFRRDPGLAERFASGRAGRAAMRYFIDPFLAPLVQFLQRRVVMAVLSAAAMGLVAGLLPLPLLAIHLSALPLLGPALVAAASGIPALALHLPLIGGAASALLSHAFEALVSELTVGSLINSLTLSSALTFPAALRQRFMDGRHGTLQPPRAFSNEWIRGVLGTAVSAVFWKQNLLSLFGLLTVGAEIEGVMSYAGALDSALSPAFRSLTGIEFRLFHSLAAAVERPQGESPVPFGGAITWGNTLLYKLQDALGFNLTDWVYMAVRGTATGLAGDPVAEAIGGAGGGGDVHAGLSVVAAVAAAAAGRPVDVKDRAGDLEREVAAVRERVSGLENQLSFQRRRLEGLRSVSKPVSEAERAKYKDVAQKKPAEHRIEAVPYSVCGFAMDADVSHADDSADG